MMPPPPTSTLFPYTTLFRSDADNRPLLVMRSNLWASGYRLERSEERFSRNAETDLVCRLLLVKKNEHPTWTLSCHDARLSRRAAAGWPETALSAQIYLFDRG